MHITSVRFRHFKALSSYQLPLHGLNVLVGPNNSGKSTIVSAFRALDVGIRRARGRGAERRHDTGYVGHRLSSAGLPLSVENVHTDYEERESLVEFSLTDGFKLTLSFSASGACDFTASYPDGAPIQTAAEFRRAVPIQLTVVPVLGPVEHQERLVEEATVRRNLSTHRASRHFRNYWHYNPDSFEQFRSLVLRTWPGMDVEPPEIIHDAEGSIFNMICLENRIPRELYWAGFGFQVWCQLLSHVVRADESTTVFVVDEPEIYLHPSIQRQLLSILRDLDADVVLATHSTEIMAEADPSEIVIVDKSRRSAKRLRDINEVQIAMEAIGSVQNITLAQLARDRRVLFVEGVADSALLRRFARLLGYDDLGSGTGITFVESGGFSSRERVAGLAWGLERTVQSSLSVGAIYDRDYWCDEEVAEIEQRLSRELHFGWILKRKEIENYLLIPEVLERAQERAASERERRLGEPIPRVDIRSALNRVTITIKQETLAQYVAKRGAFLRERSDDESTVAAQTIQWFENQWADLDRRLCIIPGKKVLRALRDEVRDQVGVNLTDAKVVGAFRVDEVPEDLERLIRGVDCFRQLEQD